MRPSGAQAAARVPTVTTPPFAATAHPSGNSATGWPAPPMRAATCSALRREGASTRTSSGPIRCRVSSTTRFASSAGANRSTAGPGAARAASTSATAPPPGESGRSREMPPAGGSSRTTRGGDALPRNAESGPAHRHEAHSASSTTCVGGPRPLERAIGFGSTPAVGATSTSTTQAPTRRPCRSIRTRLPTPTASESEGGTR